MAGTGVVIDIVATDAAGGTWLFDVAGAFTSRRGGLLRMETVWKSLGRASALRGRFPDLPLVILTTQLPRRPSDGDTAVRAAGPGTCFDVIGLLSADDRHRLRRYAKGGFAGRAQLGFWTSDDLARLPASPSGSADPEP